jgi:hypothetical protein
MLVATRLLLFQGGRVYDPIETPPIGLSEGDALRAIESRRMG